jgi:tetratricopeptide (TPR) repeat protein
MIGETFLSWRIPESFVARLEEAQAILTKTIASNTKSEQQRLYSICLAFRANIRRMLGNETGAIADSKLALDEDAENSFALQVLGLSFMREDNYNEAIQAFESITDTKVRLQVSMPLSAAYVKAGQPEDALTLLEAWAYSPDRPDGLLEAADLLLRAYDALHKIENINNLVTTLRRRWPTHPVALAAVGHQFQRQSKIEEGINLLNEALRHAAGPTKDFIALELADHYYSSGSFDKALDLYNSVADLDKNDSVTRCYLICLFNTGFHEAALALARKLRGDGEPSAVAGEIEALLLEKMGDLPAAQQLFEHLSDAYPHRHDLRIEAVECAVRRGRKDLAREILEKFEFEDIRDEGEVLMRVAQLRAVVRMDDVLRYAYQARRSAYSNPDVHANYVGLLLRKDIVQPDLHEAVAKKDCAVAVETDTGISYFIILNERDLHPERGEISLKQAEELNLLGRAKGDQCVLRRGMRGEIKCLVAEIQNKYARAFQETLEKFPSFFPTKPLIEPVKGNLDDVKDILFTQIDEQENRFEKIVSFYNQKQLGIEQLARLGDRSLIQMWGILVGGKYCKLFASEGTDEDRQQEADRVHKAESLVMDLTSLLTMAHLGLLDKLRLRFKAPIIPQPVLDAVIEAIEENASSGPSITFSKRGSDYVRHEVTSERVADYGRFLQSIRDFILTSRLVPVASLLKEKTLDLAKWKDTFGSVSTACVLAARESASLLFSDDQALRKRAAFGMGIQSVWSQSVMLELLRAEAISNEEYVEAIGKLVFLNYTFVSLDGGIVMSFLRRSEFHVSAEVRAILGAFRGPDCTVESAAIVLSQVVKDVWLEYLLFEPKVEIVEAILEVIVEGRPEEKSIELLFGLIRERFFLMHDAIQVITQIVQNWRTGRLPREGIILTD